MSTSPTLRLDDDNSLLPPAVHPTADRQEPPFDYASITDEQIQQIFDGHSYVTNSTQMSDALVVPDQQPFGLSPPTIDRPSTPIGVENLGVPRVEPVVAENDANEAAPPRRKRKVPRERISYSKRKLLAGSDFYRALDHEGAITGICGTGEIVGTIDQCPRAANQNQFAEVPVVEAGGDAVQVVT
jgi:hypothetical protein